ncbi:VOC family protein [Corynebacterium felinum]|uniref:Enzyme related to lactoylglutathione lyase n=1 Tax=Corynebacterium felinum TaxID=131318 RepID=A0ABU2B6W4_9CORY|nr:VOC family protein [Corynebacterium felinum]MDF5819776.1 VOC family protein [Corynebacterium felinum]MDR7354357.1 putative enzyme related to lactoylglutathione lyase [Corynebacterium felinum]WJY93729.1 27 kDa antigen Cfp30B [Corynebacterium felinum]
MPAFQAEPGMPYWIDLTTSDLRKSTHFYSEILGWDIEELDDGYRLARLQGLPVAGFVPRPEESQQPDTWVTYFQADDIHAECAQVEQLGGRILVPPTQVHLGFMAVVVDTAGAMFGLIQPAGEDSFIAAGEPGTPVWHELTATTCYEQAIEFYPKLFEWATATSADELYTTALVEGAAFAGIYNAQGQFPPSVPSFWQTFLGVGDVDGIMDRVEQLGGEIIRLPFDSGFGRMAIIADSTGATVTLCNAPEPVEEGRESDPLEGIDLSDFTL